MKVEIVFRVFHEVVNGEGRTPWILCKSEYKFNHVNEFAEEAFEYARNNNLKLKDPDCTRPVALVIQLGRRVQGRDGVVRVSQERLYTRGWQL